MASIRKRGHAYQITVSNGRRSDGSQIVETATFTPDPDKTERQNQKALESFVVKFEEQVKSGKYLDGEKITFQSFVETWRSDYAIQHLEPTTIQAYNFLLDKHILPAIGHLKLAKVQPVHLNRLYNTMLTERTDGRSGGYSPTTIKRTHAVISSIMATGVRWNTILENPCERVRPPKQARNVNDIMFFTLEETSAFLGEIERELAEETIQLQHKLFFHLALFCGLRRGELIALEWNDIDLNANTLSVTKSTGIVKGKAITKAPKNKTSIRTISIPGTVADVIRSYRKEQLQYRLLLGSRWEGDNHLFIQWNGCQMYPSTPYSILKKIIHKYNSRVKEDVHKLPDIPLHGLRHTSATLLISQNIDVRTVSGRLGHAQTSTTMNIYSHSLKKMDEKAAETLDNLLTISENKTLVNC